MKKRWDFFSEYKSLPKGVLALFMSRVIATLGSFVLPFLTLYFVLKLGLNENVAGFFITLISLSYIPSALIGGKLSDHYGRKNIIVICQILSAIFLLLVVFIDTASVKILFIIASFAILNISFPVLLSFIADLTTPDQRKASYSLLYLGVNVGAAVGPMIAGLLFYNYTNIIFIGDALTTIIAALVVLFMVEESEVFKNSSKEKSNVNASSDTILKVLFMNPVILAFSIISIFYFFSYAQTQFSLPLQMNITFLENGPKHYGILMSINAITVVLLTTIITKITKNLQPIFTLVLAGIFYAIGFGAFFFIENFVLFCIFTVLWTIGEILFSTNFMVYISSKGPLSHRGRITSITGIISQVGVYLSPVTMGTFISTFGVQWVWPMIFVIMIISTAMMYLLHLKSKETT
ncbi:MAG: MFS transporter [Clostridia bacterium]|nr:MFS transporter [Clostridia bacterium]